MVIGKIKEVLEKRRQRKAEETMEKNRLESYRESEQMRKAEQIKKEADRLAHLRQYKTAIEEYNKALEIFPFDAKEAMFRKPAEFFFKVYFNMAASYSCLNKLDKSINYYDQASAIDNIDNENKVKLLINKGNCYYKAKKLLEGELKNMDITILGEEENILDTLKKMDNKEGLFNLAWGCFSKAIEFDIHNADIWYKKAHIEFLMGRIKDAILSFDRVLEIDRNYENKETIGLFDDIRREK